MVRINFQPYTTSQLKRIVKARLTAARAGLPADTPDVLAPDVGEVRSDGGVVDIRGHAAGAGHLPAGCGASRAGAEDGADGGCDGGVLAGACVP